MWSLLLLLIDAKCALHRELESSSQSVHFQVETGDRGPFRRPIFCLWRVYASPAILISHHLSVEFKFVHLLLLDVHIYHHPCGLGGTALPRSITYSPTVHLPTEIAYGHCQVYEYQIKISFRGQRLLTELHRLFTRLQSETHHHIWCTWTQTQGANTMTVQITLWMCQACHDGRLKPQRWVVPVSRWRNVWRSGSLLEEEL